MLACAHHHLVAAAEHHEGAIAHLARRHGRLVGFDVVDADRSGLRGGVEAAGSFEDVGERVPGRLHRQSLGKPGRHRTSR